MFYGEGRFQYQRVDGWAQLGDGASFLDIGSITIDRQDNVYILNRSDHPIMVFDREGHLTASWGEGCFQRAHGSGIDRDGSIYCTDDRSHTVTKFTATGEVLMTLGTKGRPSDTGHRETADLWERIASITRGGPPFNRPTGVAVASTGAIYVADGYGNARVHAFSGAGEHLFSWGEPGPAPGQFRLPHSLWIDRRDRVWVPDRENNRVQIFDAHGEFLTQWTDLIRPTDVTIDDDGIVYVAELCKRISIFASDGTLLARWGNENHPLDHPLFVAPHAIAVDSRGDLYVGAVAKTYAHVDRGARTVQKFAHQS